MATLADITEELFQMIILFVGTRKQDLINLRRTCRRFAQDQRIQEILGMPIDRYFVKKISNRCSEIPGIEKCPFTGFWLINKFRHFDPPGGRIAVCNDGSMLFIGLPEGVDRDGDSEIDYYHEGDGYGYDRDDYKNGRITVRPPAMVPHDILAWFAC